MNSATKAEITTQGAASIFSKSTAYLGRVVRHDSTKRGIAAAGAGFLMSLILEAAWPTRRAI